MKKSEVTDFADLYTVRTECQKQCMIRLNRQTMDEVNEFKYLGSTLYEDRSMEGKMRASFIEKESGRIIRTCDKRENSEHESKIALQDNIIIETLEHASKTCKENKVKV